MTHDRETESATVLVTDGEQRAALAVVRALGARGFSVIVASSRARSMAGVSRFASRHIEIPSPLDSASAFRDSLAAIIEANGVDVLLPITDESLLAVLGERDRFADVAIPFVSLDRFQRISNKALLVETARDVGIAVPNQVVLESPLGENATADSAIRFPVVLKPARSVVERDGRRIKVGVSHAADASEFQRRVRAYPPEAFPLLVQERIVGPGMGVFLLVWGGELIASFGHRRIRESPPSGGVSVYCESVVPDAGLIRSSRALLERFSWEGVAMLEYKLDAATSVPYLMEVNGRFWGSLQLAIDAGVDFPSLLVRAALGHATPNSSPIRSGVRNRWEWGEVNHLLARLRRSPQELDLPAHSPGRARAVLDFATMRRGDRFEVCRLADPAPFFRETLDWFRRR